MMKVVAITTGSLKWWKSSAFSSEVVKKVSAFEIMSWAAHPAKNCKMDHIDIWDTKLNTLSDNFNQNFSF